LPSSTCEGGAHGAQLQRAGLRTKRLKMEGGRRAAPSWSARGSSGRAPRAPANKARHARSACALAVPAVGAGRAPLSRSARMGFRPLSLGACCSPAAARATNSVLRRARCRPGHQLALALGDVKHNLLLPDLRTKAASAHPPPGGGRGGTAGRDGPADRVARVRRDGRHLDLRTVAFYGNTQSED